MSKNITVTCNRNNLKEIRNFVNDTLSPVVMDDNDLNLIVLAVDEICSNLMIHSNENCQDEKISLYINIHKDPDGLLFEIIDNGDVFQYENYEEPEIADIIQQKKKGGIGLMLVRRIMDNIEFEKVNSGNICRLFKKMNNLSLASA